MDLGDEKDDEFRIETTVVDDETLDLGPFRDTDAAAADKGAAETSQQTATMEMTEEADDVSQLYSVVDRSRKSSAREAGGDDPAATSEPVTSFAKRNPPLVAL